jgi:hypothetical protein
MLWLIFCGLYLLMLFNIFRMLRQRGKWAWILFLGLIASALAYVGLVVLPLASSASLQRHRVWLVLILIGASIAYLGGLFYFVRRVAVKLKGPDAP